MIDNSDYLVDFLMEFRRAADMRAWRTSPHYWQTVRGQMKGWTDEMVASLIDYYEAKGEKAGDVK